MPLLDAIESTFKSLGSLSPGWEQALAAVPELLGAWEQGRQRPMGNVLSTLGGLIGQHAAYRRGIGDVGALQKLVTAGIDPKREPIAYQQLQAELPMLGGLDPKEAIKQLESTQATGLNEQIAALKSKPTQLRRTPDGTPYLFNPTQPVGQQITDLAGKPIPPDEFAKHEKTPEDPVKGLTEYNGFARGYLQDHPGDYKGLSDAWRSRKLQDNAIHQRDTLSRQLQFVSASRDIIDEKTLPEQVLRGSKVYNIDPADPNRLTEIHAGSMAEVKRLARSGKVAIFPPATEAKLGHARNVLHLVEDLRRAGTAVLPKGGSPFSMYSRNFLLKHLTGVRIKGGDVNAAMLAAVPGVLLQELNPILSGASRAMATPEYNRLYGEGNTYSGKKTSTLDASDVAGIVPKMGTDSQELMNAKLDVIKQLVKDQLDTMSVPMPPDTPMIITPPPDAGEAPPPPDM